MKDLPLLPHGGPLSTSKNAALLNLRSGELKQPLSYAGQIAKHAEEVLNTRLPSEDERATLLNEVHDAHHGASSMFRRLFHDRKIWWPSMLKDCKLKAKSCHDCILFDIPRTGYQPLRPVTAQFPFDSTSIDLAGPLPTSFSGNNYIFILVDDFSGFIITRAICDKSATTVAGTLWSIMCDFGHPKVIRSDRGTEFINKIIFTMLQTVGVSHHVTASYNPQANGKAESSVKLVKTTLLRLAHNDLRQWDSYLPATQAALNQRLPTRTMSTPFSLIFARSFNLSQDYRTATTNLVTEEEWLTHAHTLTNSIFPILQLRLSEQDAQMIRQHESSHSIQSPFEAGSLVMMKVQGWQGPCRVIRLSKSGSYVIESMAGQPLAQKIPHSQLKLIDLPPTSVPISITSATSRPLPVRRGLVQSIFPAILPQNAPNQRTSVPYQQVVTQPAAALRSLRPIAPRPSPISPASTSNHILEGR